MSESEDINNTLVYCVVREAGGSVSKYKVEEEHNKYGSRHLLLQELLKDLERDKHIASWNIEVTNPQSKQSITENHNEIKELKESKEEEEVILPLKTTTAPVVMAFEELRLLLCYYILGF